jgi:tRNA-specific 2-thiouridylase
MAANFQKKTKEKARALLLMSGGLDSLLAAEILAELGVQVTLLCFESYFFDCGAAKKAAAQIGLELEVVDFSKEQLEIVINPRHGRGKAINPCVDCHLLMLMKAKEMMERAGYDFIATGEVLEERPLSQNKRSLELIERKAGLQGKLLRPLSAKLLPETDAEKRGLIDRRKLGAISGRSRKIQLELAKRFRLKEIPQPSGGCILTERDYAEKLKKLLERKKGIDGSDACLLSGGRIFWEGDALVVVARDQRECANLEKLAKAGDLLFNPENFPGPTVLMRNYGVTGHGNNLEEIGEKYVLKYSKKASADSKISMLHGKNL